jgi:hypothetical protein
MQKYILDTNLFFNMEARMGLGETTEGIIRGVTEAMQKGKAQKETTLLMPPAIVAEILSFFEDPRQPFLLDFFKVVTMKSPSLSELTVNSNLMATFIEETKERAYRGMKVGEEEIQKGAALFMGKESLPQKEFQLTIGKVIKTYRDRFRNATRTGFIDSQVDFELIMLAKEQEAYLVTTDEGVIRWGRLFGVAEMNPSVFGKKMQEYL